jgi:iron complex outermembrane receptor protein
MDIMKSIAIPCDGFANESERQVFEAIKQNLIVCPGTDKWIVLSNLPHSFSLQHQPDETDLVLIDPQALVEVKHWDRPLVKRNQRQADSKADKLTDKVRCLAINARRWVGALPRAPSRTLRTAEPKVIGSVGRLCHRGIEFLHRRGKAFSAALCTLACLALAFIALGTNTNTYAQAPAPITTGPATSDQSTSLPQITVTGYIVPRIGDGPQPVTTLNQQFFKDLGAQTVDQVLQRLPQNTGGNFTPLVNSGLSFSPGASAVSLHGLGPQSTLVLMDGLRFPPYPLPQNFTIAFTDTSAVPLAAVDRIEILKDGGSAVYGSDAIAGVINVIFKDQYDGTDLHFHYGISQRGDDETYRFDAVSGFTIHPNGENSKFSVVAALDYFENSPILATDRGWSNNLAHSKYSPNYRDQFQDFNPTAGTFAGLTTFNTYFVLAGTTARNRFPLQNVGAGTPPQLLASPPYEPVYDTDSLAREQRFSGFININYDFNDHLRFHEQFLDFHSSEHSITPNQGISETDQVIVPASNPHNPTGEDLQVTGVDLIEFGRWRETADTNTLRNVAGITLKNLCNNWFADFSFVYGESDTTWRIFNSIKRNDMQQALNGTLPGFVGVFYNPFIDQFYQHQVNPTGLINALRTTQTESNRTKLTSFNFKAGGELFQLPAGPVTLGFGAEYRAEEFIASNDPNSHTTHLVSTPLLSDLIVSNILSAFFPGQLTVGRRAVTSAYGQVTIPILGGKWSWPGARILEASIDWRYDRYSDFGEVAKPKFALRYKPFDDLTFRVTYAEGFRAPSLPELFTVQIQQAFPPGLVDPQNGNSPTSPTIFVHGNRALKPVPSYGYYADITWTPGAADPEHSWWGWANGFRAYLDWYQIERHADIGQLPSQLVIDANNPAQVVRTSNGKIAFLNVPFANIGGTLTDGIDFGFTYVSKEYFWGKLDAELDANYIYNYSVKTPVPNGGFLLFDETDKFGLPDFKLLGSVFYSKTLFGYDTLRTGVTVNYVDSEHDVSDNFKGTAGPFGSAQPNGLVHRIGDWTTFDWQISYTFGKPVPVTPETPKPGYDKDGKRLVGEKSISPRLEGSRWGWRTFLAGTTLTFGINNVFDTRPPFADTFEGFDTATTNPIGRFYYLDVEKKF